MLDNWDKVPHKTQIQIHIQKTNAFTYISPSPHCSKPLKIFLIKYHPVYIFIKADPHNAI